MAEQFKPSPLVAVFEGAYGELRKQAPPLRMHGGAARDADRLVGGIDATGEPAALAGDYGFGDAVIGLFGTVWGIIDAFHGLGTAGAATLRAVAPGISKRSSLLLPDCSPPSLLLSPTTVHAAHPRIRRAHGRLQPGTRERDRARAGRGARPGRNRGAALMAFTNARGPTQSSLSEINVTPFVDVVLVLLIILWSRRRCCSRALRCRCRGRDGQRDHRRAAGDHPSIASSRCSSTTIRSTSTRLAQDPREGTRSRRDNLYMFAPMRTCRSAHSRRSWMR